MENNQKKVKSTIILVIILFILVGVLGVLAGTKIDNKEKEASNNTSIDEKDYDL